MPGNVTNIYLNPNEITFLETHNFPNVAGYLNESSKEYCNMTFYIEPTSRNKTFAFLVTNPLELDTFTVQYNQTMFSWSNYNERNYLRYPYEFQGFVIHDVWNQDYCFLESVSKDSPFLFENESQILYIRSSYFEIGRRDRSCKWKFSAPDGYGFKIVVAELYLNSDILLAVTNSTNYYIVNQRSAKINKIYYNDDQHLFIYLSHSNMSYFPSRIEFGAYITIVKTKFKIVDAKCTATGGDINVWTNINYLNPNGYPNNALCLYEIAVPKNTFISALRTDEFQEEINADTTTYYDEYSETWHDWSDDDLKGGQVFLPYSNGTTRKIKWKFSSDGSVRNGGFRIEFNKIYCFCGPSVWHVPCNGTLDLTLTNTTDNNWRYCGNLKCNFTIQLNTSCLNKYINVFARLTDSSSTNDTFRLISDNNTVFYINPSIRVLKHFSAILNPNATNIFEAYTTNADKSIPRLYDMVLSANIKPKFKQAIFLTKQKSYSIIDINHISVGDVISVLIEDIPEFENAFIEMYTSQIYLPLFIQFYTDETLFQMLEYDKNCFEKTHTQCFTNVKKVTLYISGLLDKLLLFHIAPKELVGSCLLHPNVFVEMNPYFDASKFVAISGFNGTCKTFFINDGNPKNFYKWQKIWTSVKKNNVKVFTGIKNEALLFEFNKETADKWQQLSIRSCFYIFEIPENSSIEIEVSRENENYVEIQSYDHQSVIQTPYYSTTDELLIYSSQNCFAYYSINSDIFVTFNITYFNISSFMEFQFFSNNEILNINKVGTVVSLTNANVTLCYTNTTNIKTLIPRDPGIIIHLNTILKNEVTKFVSTTSANIFSTTKSIIVSSTSDITVLSNQNYSILFITGCIAFLLLLFGLCFYLKK